MKVLKMLGAPFTALAGKVDHALETKILMSVIRHAVTALGAVLIAKGLLTPDAQSAFTNDLIEIIGFLLAGAGVVSGAAQKANAQR